MENAQQATQDKTNETLSNVVNSFDANSLANEQTKEAIKTAFKKNHYELLENKNDRVKHLASLVSAFLPSSISKLAIEQTATNNGLISADNDIKEMINSLAGQDTLEKAYSLSLISDKANNKNSLVTEFLRNEILKSQLKNTGVEQTQDNILHASNYITLSIDKPVSDLAGSLDLGKESFLTQLLH